MKPAPIFALALLGLTTSCSGDYTFTPPDENVQPLVDLDVTTAGALGLPLVPGSDGAIEDFAEARALEGLQSRSSADGPLPGSVPSGLKPWMCYEPITGAGAAHAGVQVAPRQLVALSVDGQNVMPHK